MAVQMRRFAELVLRAAKLEVIIRFQLVNTRESLNKKL